MLPMPPPDTVNLPRLRLATRWSDRLLGLLVGPPLGPGEALLLRPCGAIHTCFMRQTIDAVFLGPTHRVLSVRAHLPPWRAAAAWGACQVLELAAGQANALGLRPGVTVVLEPNPS